ncbi:MAG: hypothetical protein VXZ73_00600 [Pseudomonadota bacterium]|nr:hypothetical protein [Pseudomonadota bacterium]MEC8978249.1 hypothetical protein [Pseudomonadota bacterium]
MKLRNFALITAFVASSVLAGGPLAKSSGARGWGVGLSTSHSDGRLMLEHQSADFEFGVFTALSIHQGEKVTAEEKVVKEGREGCYIDSAGSAAGHYSSGPTANAACSDSDFEDKKGTNYNVIPVGAYFGKKMHLVGDLTSSFGLVGSTTLTDKTKYGNNSLEKGLHANPYSYALYTRLSYHPVSDYSIFVSAHAVSFTSYGDHETPNKIGVFDKINAGMTYYFG